MLNGNFTLNKYRGTARYADDAARKRIYDYLTKLTGSVFAYDNKEAAKTVVADFATAEERNEFTNRFGNGVIVQRGAGSRTLAAVA